MKGIYLLLMCISIDPGYIIAFYQRNQVFLPHLLNDISVCLTESKLSVPLHYKHLMSMLVTCVNTRVTFCLLGRDPMMFKQFDRAINNLRYCGFYASDLQDSHSNIQIRVLEGHSILVDFIYFNLKWSHSFCSDQGVMVAANTQTRTVYCGKRLPWQYMHPHDSLRVKIYGLNSLVLPKYLYIFFEITDRAKWRECCQRMSMPKSLNFINTLESSVNYFYVVSLLNFVISVEADTFNRPGFLMFDGPGKISPMYEVSSNMSILSSSSQIVISALSTFQTDGHLVFTYIDQFKTERLKKRRCFHYIVRGAVMSTNIDIQFGKKNKNNYICHYMLQGTDTLFYRPHINITMLTLSGPTSHTTTLVNACQYGGIYVHTKNADDEFKLRIEMCGNIAEPTPSFISYNDRDLLLSFILYRGYITGHFVAEVQVMACSVVPLPCGIDIREGFYLSKYTMCNIFYFVWLGDTTQRHYCKFRLESYHSQIIGPTELSITTNSNSAPDQHMATDVTVSTRSYKDWPQRTVKKHTLNLNFTKAQNLQRKIEYLDILTVRFRGAVQSDRLLKLKLKIADRCLPREGGEMNFSVVNNALVHHFCNTIQTLRSNQSLSFIYAPYDATEHMTIYTVTSPTCATPPSSILYVMEQTRETRTHYNYTVNSMKLRFKTKHTSSYLKFFLRYTTGNQSIAKECELSLFMDISYIDEKLQKNRNELVQAGGRYLTFYEARLVKKVFLQLLK